MEFYYRVLSYFNGTYTLKILANFFSLGYKILPYLIISIFLSSFMSHYFRKQKINFAHSSEIVSVIVGGLIGLVSPLPTYVALPVGISLAVAGTPFSAVLAFTIASPLMNPTVFYLTMSQLGWGMALARTVAALFLSLGGAVIFKIFTGWLEPDLDIRGELNKKSKKRNRPYYIELYKTMLFIGKYFTIAIFISSLVKSLVPPEFISNILGGGNVRVSMLSAIALGVPFYSCGGAAIPLIQVLQDMGMHTGGALAFFIAGPATKLETLYIYRSLLGLKLTLFYLGLTLAGSYLAGFIYITFFNLSV